MRLLYLHNESLDFQRANVLQVLNMCKAFADHGVAVTLALAGSDAAAMEERIRQEFGPVPGLHVLSYRRVTVANRLKILGSYFGVRRLLHTATADLCFVRDPLMCALAVRAGLRTVYESHNARFQNRSGFLNAAWERYILRTVRQPSFLTVIAISEALARVWRARGVPERQVLTLHDGFDAALFSRRMTPKEARGELGLDASGPVVVYTGSLYQDRGIDSILLLAERLPHAQFLVVGGPDDARDRFQREALARGLRNVTFTGRVPHGRIPLYLAAADVLLMLWSNKVPTINYCSPMKVFEYMAAGRIIVGHGFPTIREVLQDGATALLADPASFDELHQKLETALSQDAPAGMAERSREEAYRRYSWHARAGEILKRCGELEPSLAVRGSETDASTPAHHDGH